MEWFYESNVHDWGEHRAPPNLTWDKGAIVNLFDIMPVYKSKCKEREKYVPMWKYELKPEKRSLKWP